MGADFVEGGGRGAEGDVVAVLQEDAGEAQAAGGEAGGDEPGAWSGVVGELRCGVEGDVCAGVGVGHGRLEIGLLCVYIRLDRLELYDLVIVDQLVRPLFVLVMKFLHIHIAGSEFIN